ncbi:MAG: 2-phospho-L-lactate transferase CofD family protein, partial [Candidatus Saccharimonadales bacterium]
KADFELDPPTAKLSQKAREHIEKADLIIIAPGNFYCSIIPALIVEGMSDALSVSSAKKVLVTNIANFQNHTRGYTVGDYLAEISRITHGDYIDTVLTNNNLNLGTNDAAVITASPHPIEMIQGNLVSNDKQKPDPNDKIAGLRSNVKHDKDKLNKLITQILRS